MTVTMDVGRGAALWAVPLGMVLVVGGAVPVAQAVGPGAPAAAESCADEAPQVDAASALAVRCDRDVEVLDARSAWTTTYALPDGSMRLETSIAAVRTDVSGQWEPVDPTVVPGDGGYGVASAVTPMTFSDGSDGAPLARIERDGHEVVFDAPFDLPAPSVDGSQLTYPEVLPGVDLVVTVDEDATGFSEVLRVESPEAAANPALAELTFDVETSDGIELAAADGGFVVADASGARVFTSPLPTMWDSSEARAVPGWDGLPDPGVGTGAQEVDPTVAPAPGAEVVVMPSDVAPDAVTITPDAEVLAEPGTQWPVFIDPGISGTLHHRIAVRTEFGNLYNFTGAEGVGLCDVRVIADCDRTYRARVLWQFAGLHDLASLDARDVKRATFAVTGTHSYSCTPMPVTLHAVSDFDHTTVYPGGAYWQPLQTQTITHRPGCGAGKEPRRIEFDVTSAAASTAGGDRTTASFGMAADEGSMASWKRYGADATLSVEFNRLPAPPADLSMSETGGACATGDGRPFTRTVTPQLNARVSDPDGSNVQSWFELRDLTAGGAVVWGPEILPAQGSGAGHHVRVPGGRLQENRTYRWEVRGLDDWSELGPPTACEFTVDLTPPRMPAVAPVEGRPAMYREDATSGGVGHPGLLQFSDAGSGDVVEYRYSLASTALGNRAPASTPTVLVRPRQVGTQTLSVVAVDRAGWTSPRRDYRFSVAFPGLSNAWRLDETGTTAADLAGSAPLTITGTPGRGPGLPSDLGGAANDRALVFDSDDDAATAAGPVVATDRTFSVSAFVRLDDVTRDATAVSQAGQVVPGFELGHRVGASCPEETGGHCWAFSMPGSDTAGEAAVVTSSVPVRQGAWAHLTATRDPDGRLGLTVCDIGTAGAPGDQNPLASEPQAGKGAWSALGRFRIGSAQAAGGTVRAWRGAVSEVRTYVGVLTIDKLRTACRNPASLFPLLEPAVAPPDTYDEGDAEVTTFTLVPYKMAYDYHLYRVSFGVPRRITPEEWSAAGLPGYQMKAVDYVKYPWSPSVYGVTSWPSGSKVELLTYEQWTTAGTPGVRDVAWVDGSDIYKSASAPEIYVKDPAGAVHQLTPQEWAATGHRQPRIVP
ncbi:hypothetical protein H9657_05975 [Cellulomonas sp. Sa3CUA2]|uniref:LamG-like jellyroll fold domain-containing protein n=1 Tax=Cellulomonas avistercoris TaxID=2762242 RepID=A0ABR8QBM5_9CELL|nr:LamG-like jellyroll fold domain-containing protein [Cellulomonas avistercoris]MBD7917825.1 hypothetical protein [Cellulomonas avistercoris]